MITSAVCNSFKRELVQAIHDFDTDTIKIALFDANATLNADTTEYSTTNECTGLHYSAGGIELTVSVTDGSIIVIDFDDAVFEDVSVSAMGALIYNSSKGNRSILTLNFGATYTTFNEDFNVVFPTPTAETGLIVIR